MVGLTSVTVWALTKTKSSSSFKVSFVGSRYINLDMNGEVYVNGELKETKTINIYTDNDQDPDLKQDDFESEYSISLDNTQKNLTFKYTITNKSKNYDLIIKPVVDEFIETNNLIHSTYYSLDGGTTKHSVEDFITIHKAKKNASGAYEYDEVVVEMNFFAENGESINAENNCALEFYSSESKPAGYRDSYKYTVGNVGGSKVAYKQEYCETCHQLIGNKQLMHSSTYVIATPDTVEHTDKNGIVHQTTNAQMVLDGPISNKVVIFDEGISGNTNYEQELIIRPSLASGDETIADFTSPSAPVYVRRINNVVFASADGALLFNNKIKMATGSFKYAATGTYEYDAVKDANRDTWINQLLEIDGIIFQDLLFMGSQGRIELRINGTADVDSDGAIDYKSSLNNAVVKDCTFDNSVEAVDPDSSAGIDFNTNMADAVSNVRIANCSIDNHISAIKLMNAHNVSIVNNIMNNSYTQMLLMQNYNGVISGTIKILDNSFNSTTGVVGNGSSYDNNLSGFPIKIAVPEDALIVVQNNQFANTHSAYQKFMVTCSTMKTGVYFTFVDNTYYYQGVTSALANKKVDNSDETIKTFFSLK